MIYVVIALVALVAIYVLWTVVRVHRYGLENDSKYATQWREVRWEWHTLRHMSPSDPLYHQGPPPWFK